MKLWCLKHSCPYDVLHKKMKKTYFSKISSTRKDNTKDVLLQVMYQPGLKNIGQLIGRNLHLLYIDQQVKKVFNPKPMFFLA